MNWAIDLGRAFDEREAMAALQALGENLWIARPRPMAWAEL